MKEGIDLKEIIGFQLLKLDQIAGVLKNLKYLNILIASNYKIKRSKNLLICPKFQERE